MAITSLPGATERSDVFHRWVSGTGNIYLYLDDNDWVWKKIDEGSWSQWKQLTSVVGIIQARADDHRICISDTGEVCLLLETSVAGDLGFEVVVYSNTGTLLSTTTVSAHVAGNDRALNFNAIGIEYGDTGATSQFHVTWNEFYRTMGTNYYFTRFVSVTKLGVVFTVTGVYQGTEGSNRNRGVAFSPAYNHGVFADDTTGRYQIIGVFSPQSSSTTSQIFQDNKPDINVRIYGTSTADANYHVSFSGNNLTVKTIPVSSSVSIASTIVNQTLTADVSALYCTGAHLSADKLELYVYYHAKLTDNTYVDRMWTIDVDMLHSLSRSAVLEFDNVSADMHNAGQSSWNLIVGTNNIGGMLAKNLSANNTIIKKFAWEEDVVNAKKDIRWEAWTPSAGGVLIDLTVDVGTSGGKALSAFIEVDAASRILVFLELSNAVTGVTIKPQDEIYTLTIGALTIPMVWFTVRKTISNITVLISVTIAVPREYQSAVSDEVGNPLVISKKVFNTTKQFITGTLTEVRSSDVGGTIQLVVEDTEAIQAGIVNIDKTLYIRTTSNKTTVRIPPYTNISVGQLVKTKSIDIQVESMTLHVSAIGASFLEIR